MRVLMMHSVVAAALLVAGCSAGGEPDAPAEDPAAAPAAEATGVATVLPLTESASIPTEPADPVLELVNARYIEGIAGRFVVVEARFGGCGDQTFAAYWDGSWMESNPPQINIMLTHDNLDQMCEMMVTQTLQIDVTDLTETQPEFTANVFVGDVKAEPVMVGEVAAQPEE